MQCGRAVVSSGVYAGRSRARVENDGLDSMRAPGFCNVRSRGGKVRLQLLYLIFGTAENGAERGTVRGWNLSLAETEV